MRWPTALLTARRRRLALFVVVELCLAMAIPFVAIAGYHQLLNSTAGSFTTEPGRTDPGWRALVDASPVAAVVEVDNGVTTGVVILAAPAPGGNGGTAILVPGSLDVDGVAINSVPPLAAADLLSRQLRLRFSSVEVVDDARWPNVLGDRTYNIDNPDPVQDVNGAAVFTVGPMAVGADNAAMFLGRSSPGVDPITLLFRRRIFWSALLADPSPHPDPLATMLMSVAGPSARVVDLPLATIGPSPTVEIYAAEQLIHSNVPIPAGSEPGDRVRVRIIDRTGSADLESIAASVASTGVEVVEIGNAAEFDDGPSQIVASASVDPASVSELMALTGVATVQTDSIDTSDVVTLVVGEEFLSGQSLVSGEPAN